MASTVQGTVAVFPAALSSSSAAPAVQPHRHPSLTTTAQPLVATSSSSLNSLNEAGRMSQSQPSSQQSFSLSQPPPPTSSQSFRPFGGQSQGHDDAPQIYSAVYSGVDVYEMEVNGVAVMRRRNDSCLNATQILKVAGVDKGKRTKILEKEIQTGEHEKVQGGYGKYQGTWIKFDRGVEVCRQYGVEELLRPLLTYDMGQDGGVAGRGDFNTPTKEQAMAAQRKRMYNNTGNADGRSNSMSGTFFKNISSTASNAVAAISKARLNSPGPQGRNGPTRPPSFSHQSSMQNNEEFPGNSQQSMVSDFGQQPDSAFSTQNIAGLNGDEPARKRQRVITPADSFGYTSQSMELYANQFPGSPTEPNESFIYSQIGVTQAAEDGTPLPPLPRDGSVEGIEKKNQLMGLFAELPQHARELSQAQHAVIQSMSPADLDLPIDNPSNTALHWAATLGRIPLLRALIAAGASLYRVNASGETALMRASAVTNCSEQLCFPELLDILGNTIEIRDGLGRTVLHHIAIASAINHRSNACRYYLESLLEWVVRQGSVPNSQNSANGNPSGTAHCRINLARFMSEIVNAQDKNGDTALNIASRIRIKSIISQLLEVGADPGIANNTGLRPIDFGFGADSNDVQMNGVSGEVGQNGVVAIAAQKSRESSNDIIGSITNLMTEVSKSFQIEVQQKQIEIDTLRASLRTTSAQLNGAKQTLETLQVASMSQSLSRQRTFNLARGREEEQAKLARVESSHGPLAPSATGWETELVLNNGSEASSTSAAVLRARIRAMRHRADQTKKAVAALQGRSKDVELKYRRVVSLCTGVPEQDVDEVIDGLLKAVESERGDLEIGRVRRFLGGVEGTVR